MLIFNKLLINIYNFVCGCFQIVFILSFSILVIPLIFLEMCASCGRLIDFCCHSSALKILKGVQLIISKIEDMSNTILTNYNNINNINE